MTIRYDGAPYQSFGDVQRAVELEECRLDAVYFPDTATCEVDAYLIMKRDRSRTYRVVSAHHTRKRNSRRRY